MNISKTNIEGLFVIEPKVFGDNRGWFAETFRADKLNELGINTNFVQDNQSFSAQKGTLRGIHFQNFPYALAKLVRCTRGALLDVAVDLRPNSPTFKQWFSIELSAENKKQLYIPRGFGHGFVSLSNDVEIQYKTDDYYSNKHDRSIRFDDPSLKIEWGINEVILSDKDKSAPFFKDSDFNFGERILVTGVRGQLGYDVVKKLQSKSIDCRGIDYQEMDITNPEAVHKYITEYNPTIIIHCAAYTAVDKAEEEQDKCFAVNVTGTENIAKAAKQINAKMIYISSEYVYGSDDSKFNKETDNTNPKNYYAKTKLDGEVAVQKIVDKHFIIRTSWVFGKNGNNFIKTMLRLGSEKSELNVVGDQIGSPTYTVDLAKIIVDMIFTENYGTYNVSNEDICSWADFATEIFKQAGFSTKVNAIATSEYPTKAQRQLGSRMSKDKLAENGFGKLPTWQDALKRYMEEIK